MTNLIDLTGKVFDRITVIRRLPNRNNHTQYECLCNCGTSLKVDSSSLIRGNTRSCGCLRKENSRNKAITHGMRNDRTYNAWRNMKARCLNPHQTYFENYGGRGIKVCEKWANSFESFYADMGSCPSAGHSLDRYPNPDGNYEPGNCRWATRTQQNRNCRRNRRISFNGDTLTMAEWTEILEFPPGLISTRINKHGWTEQEALSTPPGVRRPKKPI